MAARIGNGRVQLLSRTRLDWTDKYPSAIAALANLNVKTDYLDGELCGVDEAGLPTFAHTQAATDGEREVRLVYYAFDLLHLDGSSSAKRFWSRCSETSRAFSSTAMRSVTANLSSDTPASSDLRAWSRRRSMPLMRLETAAYGAKRNG
jgi:ATP dependent DNA ligase domain